MSPQRQGTVTGAAIGAAAGAGITVISGGSGWTGAAIGGIAVGVAGNIKGSKQQYRHLERTGAETNAAEIKIRANELSSSLKSSRESTG